MQERVARASAGRSLAPAILFCGCQSADDKLYLEAFERWHQLGAVSLRPAFSRTPEESQGCTSVQARIRHDKADVVQLLEVSARLVVCAPEQEEHGIRQALVGIVKEDVPELHGKGVDDAVAGERLDGAWLAWKSRRNK